jgi:Ser-tRNA(Ala) deacylase AlaX
MTARPSFRPYRPGDREACLALFDANTPEFFAPNERAAYIEFLDGGPAYYRVCLAQDQIAGAFGLNLTAPGLGSLKWILVQPRAHGRGIGSAMMRQALDLAREAGVKTIEIGTSHKSAPFFARHGAERVRETPEGWGPGMHRVDMELRVVEGGAARKVYWEDPYLARLETRIMSIDGASVTVERTILYPFSGGQERDHGRLGGREVLDARLDGREIVYTLENTEGLSVGDLVPMEIDWERRYALMRLHLAAELVLEAACRLLPSIEKIGAHIARDKARIDFLWPESLGSQLPGIRETVSRLVAEDREILSAFSDEVGERRYWEVKGFARVACGGTHLKRTGEIGAIRLRRDNIGRGKERIEIYLEEAPEKGKGGSSTLHG